MFYDHRDIDTEKLTALLANEASRFCNAPEQGKAFTIVVSDWEFLYDYRRHRLYCHAEGEGAEQKVRWPFHRIVAGAWAVIEFPVNGAVPYVRTIDVYDPRTSDELAIVESYFRVLNANPAAVPVSWGAEFKDLQAVRMVASMRGLRIPAALRVLNPFSPGRADLNMATATKGHLVHLPEYAFACDVPTKAVSSKDVGPAALAGDWETVHEQVLSDIFTISIIAARHLASQGVVDPIGPRCDAAILDAFVKTFPQSRFLTVTCGGWAAHRRDVAARQLAAGAGDLSCPPRP